MRTVAFAVHRQGIEPIAGIPVEPHLVVFPVFKKTTKKQKKDRVVPQVLGWRVLYQPSGRGVPTRLFADSEDAIAFARRVSRLLGEEPRESFFQGLKGGDESADGLLEEYKVTNG